GREYPAFSTNETGCVCFPSFRDRQGGEKAPRHDACGHDSAAARTIMSAALSFHENFSTAGCALPPLMFAVRSRVKEEYFDQRKHFGR
ncbi:hypothetical protein, partial [Mesorhizobium sp. M5C.F.Ca.IN.020.32.2.1]|uniref:hypothetical protein n=1 Tax=Mesorhizobium sp. M5C.F.Ca.IN.020.32.2.1 TaxID=2496771 RepID=UPI0019D46112